MNTAISASVNPVHPGTTEVSPQLIGYALARWCRIAAPIGLLLAITAALLVRPLLEPVFRATAWVKIEARKPMLVFPDGQDSPMFVNTQIEMIKSRLVLGRAIARPDIESLADVQRQKAPLDWLLKHLMVKCVGNSELFQVNFESPDPRTSELIVNGILESYLQTQAELADSGTQRTIELLEREKAKRAIELERLRQNLRVLVKNASGATPLFFQKGDVTLAAQSLYNPLAALQERLTTIKVERDVLQAKRKSLAESLALPPAMVPVIAAPSPIEVAWQVEIATLKMNLAESDLGTRHPTVVRWQTRLTTLKQDLVDLQQQSRAESQAAVSQQQQMAMSALDRQIVEHRTLEDLLCVRHEQQRLALEAFGDQSVAMELARDEWTRTEDLYQRLADRAMAIKTEMDAPARVTLLERARAPAYPIQQHPLMRLAAAAAFFFVLPFVLAVAWECRRHRISESQRFVRETQVPIAAEVVRPHFTAARVARADVDGDRGTAWGRPDAARESPRSARVGHVEW